MSLQIILNIIFTASIYLLIAQSFKLLYETARFIVISHAISITLSGYCLYFFSIQLDFSFIISAFFSIFLVVILAVVLFFTVYKPLLKRNTEPFLILISSLGLYVVLENLIKIIWGDDTKPLANIQVQEGVNLMNAYLTNHQILSIIISISAVFLTIIFLNNSKIGIKIKAVSSNTELCNNFGINSFSVILIAFIIGTILASIAGFLIAYDVNLRPSMGFNYLLFGIVALIIGGIGSTKGLIGGAMLLSASQHFGAYYLSSTWMDAIAYLILVLFLIWKPLGFSGKKLKKVNL